MIYIYIYIYTLYVRICDNCIIVIVVYLFVCLHVARKYHTLGYTNRYDLTQRFLSFETVGILS